MPELSVRRDAGAFVLRAVVVVLLVMLLDVAAVVDAGDRGGGRTGSLAVAEQRTATTSGLQDDRSAAVSWSGSRSRRSTAAAYDGSMVQLAGRASATFRFRGTGVAWLARVGPFDGRADVYLDGRRVQRVDLWAAAKAYQQTVYRVNALPAGTHVLRVVRTGTKSRRSKGRNVTVDAFQVLDGVPPADPSGLVVRAEGTSAVVGWAAPAEDDVAGYRVSRSTGAGGEDVVVGTTGPTGRELVDAGLASGRYVYRVQAFDTSGNRSAWSTAEPLDLVVPEQPWTPRYADCPAATVVVGDVAELTEALRLAGPGTVVRLLPGRYPGQVDVTVHGTAEAPVWVCGPPSAVLDGGDPSKNAGLRISGSSHLVVAGLSVRRSLKGVSVLASTAVVLADLTVSDIGQEGVHLKFSTTDSVVVGTSVVRTGLVSPEYGEGVYVGTDHNNWCLWTGCAPDRSDRNRVAGNSISGTAAEPVEVKEGTTGGVVSGNEIDGTGSDVGRLVAVKGSGWTVSGNVGRDSTLDGVQVLRRAGYGSGNVIYGNTFTGRLPGYGVRLPAGDTSTVVGCDTEVPTTSRGVSNMPCQP